MEVLYNTAHDIEVRLYHTANKVHKRKLWQPYQTLKCNFRDLLTFEQQLPWPTSSTLGHIYITLKNGFVCLVPKMPIFGRPAFMRIKQSDRNIPA
jgi:hypothetical protein